jgi:hypothetical protein
MARSLAEFIDLQIRSVERWSVPESPDRSQCLVVERVARTCVAATAGVVVGDLVVAVDDEPAVVTQPRSDDDLLAARRFLFYNDERSEHIRLDVTGIDIGVELGPTAESIDGAYRRGDDASRLSALWHMGEWKLLEELARFEATGKRRRAGVLGRLFAKKPGPTPATLLMGAAVFEQGRVTEGLTLIERYTEARTEAGPDELLGIALFYLGRAAEAAGDIEAAVDRLSLAHSHCPSERIAARLEELTGDRAGPRRPTAWQGELFPFPYRLNPIEGERPPVSLGATFADMPEDQLLAVCLAGEGRAAPRYFEFLSRFRGYARFAASYLHGLHVLVCGDGTDSSDALAAEERLRGQEVIIEVLRDADGRVHEALAAGAPPDVLLLSASGKICHRGTLDSIDFWDALAARY